MQSLGSRLGTTQTQDFVLLGGMVLVGYVLYNLILGIKTAGAGVVAAGKALTSVGDALGSGLYTLFGPSDAQILGETVYLTVAFPDGRHAVPSSSVNPDGTFTWTGYPPGSMSPVTYQLVKDASNQWYATVNTDFGVTNTTGWS